MSDETTAMTVHQGGSAVQTFDESRATLDRLMVVRETLAPDLTNTELQLFAMVAVRSGLDPFARQIFAVKRAGRMTIQTGIDGYRSIASRTGEYDGQDEPTFGEECPCGKAPQGHPISSTVRVYRKTMSRGVAATAYWHEYCPDPGPSGKGDQMWRKMPHVMIAKVAEALALRKAFPWDPTRGTGIGADVYTSEEMAQAQVENVAPPSPSLEDRVASRAQALGPGLTLREFASRAVELEAEQVREVRKAMFPDVAGVSDLTDAQRLALWTRLTEGPLEVEEDEAEDAPTGTPPVLEAPATAEEVEGEYVEVQEEAQPVQEIPDAAMVDDGEPRILPPACDGVSPISGEVCDREKGHRGRHRSKDLKESW